MTNSSSFRLTVRVTAYISFLMQTLPLDRKSPGKSTRGTSTRVARERPSQGAARAAADGEKDAENDGDLAEFAATSSAPLGALAGRLEQLGRGLVRVGVEPLAYAAGLLSRLLHASRRLMGMGHPPRPRQDGARADSRARPRRPVRKTHRLQATCDVRGAREHEPAGRDRTLRSSHPRTRRRLSRCVVLTAQACPSR